MKEVVAESAFLNLSIQIASGSSDDPNVGLDGLRAAQRANLVAIDGAQ